VKVLITGGGGQLARQLMATAPPDVQAEALLRTSCDITDQKEVERVVTSFGPDVVINAAAYTRVDDAEDAPDVAFLINARGAENVARSAAKLGARLIHVSTDYVFDGDRTTPYPPDARTNPLNVYGASKLEGEGRVLAASPGALVVRAGWLYSRTGKSFLMSILKAVHASKPVRVVCDQVGCPTSAYDLARMLWMATQSTIRGIHHWANAGSASWYDFAVEIVDVLIDRGFVGGKLEIIGVTTEQYGSRAKRPRYTVLDASLLASTLQITQTPWQAALRAELMRASE
jgi:dTDP-4-dehydrorhamnose reductase